MADSQTLHDNLFLSALRPSLICGVDEAGRGPLAGPVYAAAVILPDDFPFSCLDDSKRLTEGERRESEAIIKSRAAAWSVSFATHIEIDRLNILQASLLAMKRAVMRMPTGLFESVLVDGNKLPDIDIPGKFLSAIVKGDATVPQIMAASILAKTARDEFMKACDLKWPQYGYAKHKGYPTAAHLQAIRTFGPSPIQRMTFRCPEKR